MWSNAHAEQLINKDIYEQFNMPDMYFSTQNNKISQSIQLNQESSCLRLYQILNTFLTQ